MTLVIGAIVFWNKAMNFDNAMRRRFEAVEIGDLRAEVCNQMLGTPELESKDFCLPQRNGFEKLFEEAAKSNAMVYLRWKNGANWYYCIGFDTNGRVAFKGQGNS